MSRIGRTDSHHLCFLIVFAFGDKRRREAPTFIVGRASSKEVQEDAGGELN